MSTRVSDVTNLCCCAPPTHSVVQVSLSSEIGCHAAGPEVMCPVDSNASGHPPQHGDDPISKACIFSRITACCVMTMRQTKVLMVALVSLPA